MHLYYNQQYNKLRDQVNPNIHELEQFLHANEAYEQAHKLRGLKLKYQAMTREPTTIEKTMTPYQLYQANNPLWAQELSALGMNFLKTWEPSETYSEYEDRWEKAVSVYTNFSGNTVRLYDVLYRMREYKDEFSREGDYTVNVSTKAELERILVKETDDALLNKWDDIMEYLETIDDDETLYFFTD